MTHEYATVLLYWITLKKGKGWRLWHAPSWFVQGYEEYLGLHCSSQHSRTVTRNLYIQDVAKESFRVILGEKEGNKIIATQKVYQDGVVLLIFMHETYGRTRVQNILSNTSDNFYESLTTELGIDLQTFFKDWKKWIADNK